MNDCLEKNMHEISEGKNAFCELKPFLLSIGLVLEMEEFKTSDIQRYLQCGYGTAYRVADALCALSVIEDLGESPKKYRRSADPALIKDAVKAMTKDTDLT